MPQARTAPRTGRWRPAADNIPLATRLQADTLAVAIHQWRPAAMAEPVVLELFSDYV